MAVAVAFTATFPSRMGEVSTMMIPVEVETPLKLYLIPVEIFVFLLPNSYICQYVRQTVREIDCY